MDTKKDILWRSYLIYIAMLIFGISIFGNAFYIQRIEGKYWKSLSDSLHLEYREIDAERGTIYSEDGRMLSSSVPYFDVYLDFGSEGVQENNGEVLRKSIDSLAIHLSEILGSKSSEEYKNLLWTVFNNKNRYYQLHKNIDFKQYQRLKATEYLKEYKNKNGFIFIEKEKRVAPYGILARRTIGLSREYMDSARNLVNKNVGLELTYDSLLKGNTGKRLMRRVAGKTYIPVEGLEIAPTNGKDIVTTIDVTIQGIAENALLKMLEKKGATYGTCIVMEVSTGKIKAIANLGRESNGNYGENSNYAVIRSEPGSTFKLVTMLAALEDQYINLDTKVNLEGGRWPFNGETVIDSDPHSSSEVNYKQAFELSSNVAMAKLAVNAYYTKPEKFINHIKRLQLDKITGVGIVGESVPSIASPGAANWSNVALPWMSFGYNVEISPLQVLMLYNAVANEGKMLKPYLVKEIVQDGKVFQTFQPKVVMDSICSSKTLVQLQHCLEGVVLNGTAHRLKSSNYSYSGKTGTTLVANGKKGYTEKIYQSSFAGYFPSVNPKYSVIVVIKNKKGETDFYGSTVALPVFREIADVLFTLDRDLYKSFARKNYTDSTSSVWKGLGKDFKTIAKKINTNIVDSGVEQELKIVKTKGKNLYSTSKSITIGEMPDVRGFGLKDALELLEKQQLQVIATGKGKVVSQSISPGTAVQRQQTVYLNLANTIE